MTKFLLAVHVLAAILAVGPVAVAASMFPPAARRVLAVPGTTRDPGVPSPASAASTASSATAASTTGDPGATTGTDAGTTVLLLLHRICRVYALVGVVVPVFGFATARELGVLGSAWLVVSIGLTVLAAVVLAVFVLPAQSALLEGSADRAGLTVRLAMCTGLFNLLWAAVTVLMIVRPGSTTGA
ncbi:hypothetical protein AB0F03_14275 [Streptomyces sp. NPDC028722]|uniref:hypothetical protein n=1 Tax=Streptomyces sp. NPDC028722 TaxID=3155016 RepID=UPI0033C18789